MFRKKITSTVVCTDTQLKIEIISVCFQEKVSLANGEAETEWRWSVK